MAYGVKCVCNMYCVICVVHGVCSVSYVVRGVWCVYVWYVLCDVYVVCSVCCYMCGVYCVLCVV